jgi:T-complex protein 1 subunit alpha
MAFFAKDPRSTMLLGGGERVSGAEMRNESVLAAVAIANVVQRSLGPNGLDSMLVDDRGVGPTFSDTSFVFPRADAPPAART